METTLYVIGTLIILAGVMGTISVMKGPVDKHYYEKRERTYSNLGTIYAVLTVIVLIVIALLF